MSQLETSINGITATIKIERPEKRNSLTPEMLYALEESLNGLKKRNDVRFVVITGAGEKAFCTGADLHAFARYTPLEVRENWVPEGHRIFQTLFELPQITIAKINGDALGGGLELALACDLRIARSDARFGFPENRVGTMPGWNGFRRVVEVIGLARAKELILTGESISAAQAHSWSLVNEVCEFSQLDQNLDSLIHRLSQSAPIAQRISKQILNAFQSHQSGTLLESLGGAISHMTNDFQEGFTSFKEKRPARFKGE